MNFYNLRLEIDIFYGPQTDRGNTTNYEFLTHFSFIPLPLSPSSPSSPSSLPLYPVPLLSSPSSPSSPSLLPLLSFPPSVPLPSYPSLSPLPLPPSVSLPPPPFPPPPLPPSPPLLLALTPQCRTGPQSPAHAGGCADSSLHEAGLPPSQGQARGLPRHKDRRGRGDLGRVCGRCHHPQPV